MDAKTLAETLGITRRKLDALIAEGMPVQERGGKAKPWAFKLAAVARWLMERSERPPSGERLNPSQERARRDKAAADLAELELQERQGELVPAEQADASVIGVASACAQRLAGVPSKAGPEARQARTDAEAEAIVRRHVDDAREAMANAAEEAEEHALAFLRDAYRRVQEEAEAEAREPEPEEAA